MFLITFKKGENAEKSNLKFDKSIKFHSANEMLLEAIEKYKITGIAIKIRYNIIDVDTEKLLFNSRITINNETSNLFEIIKGNDSIPRNIRHYVSQVEKNELEEPDNEIFLFSNLENREVLDKLKAEKKEKLLILKRSESESKQREIEHQKIIESIEKEKEKIVRDIEQFDKDEKMKETERELKLRELEEQKLQAKSIMDEKRAEDKEKRKTHKKQLEEIESEKKQIEYELQKTLTESENEEFARQNELNEYEEEKKEFERQSDLLEAENQLAELEHEKNLTNLKSTSSPVNNKEIKSSYEPTLSLKEKIQDLDYETIKAILKHCMKFTWTYTKKGSKLFYLWLKSKLEERAKAKEAKRTYLAKKEELEIQMANAKVNFLNELKKEKDEQDRLLKKANKEREKEKLRQERIQKRYISEVNKSIKTIKLPGGFKVAVSFFFLIAIGIGVIYYFEVGPSVPLFNDIRAIISSKFSN
ncbi:hypothetical protein BTS2_3342 [Bacillus sp. TS-2]|nr:hypothetical protein BTS2_3342 [Bacillus sp. TS-2]